jgi:deoxyribonuclease-1
MALLSKILRGVASVLPIFCAFSPASALNTSNNPGDPFGCARLNIKQSAVSLCNLEKLGELANHGLHTSSYKKARTNMFQTIDVFVTSEGVRSVKSVYSPDIYPVGDSGIPQNGVNCEHSWPQSYLKQSYRFREARSDLFHLFPVTGRVNSRRNNLPFADCGFHSQTDGVRCHDGFEPPEGHKGVLARAMFYVSATYNLPLGNAQERLLREWNDTHPVTQAELDRSARIHEIQGNDNPFIQHPEWIDLVDDF